MPEKLTFTSGQDLQEYLLREGGPDSLILVPHRRLARQLWHKQRLRNLEQGVPAWEPLPAMTLPDWWRELYQHLWAPYAPAPRLVRLALWQQALTAVPTLEGLQPDLTWAEALDEAQELLLRHDLPICQAQPDDPPLLAWRRQVSRIYQDLLREAGWLTPGEVPNFLFQALAQGGLPLPRRILVAGLETPAPLEERWLKAVSEHLSVTRLLVKGHPQNITEALVFPDQEQELAWAAAKLVEWQAQEKLPLHRLAVTSPVMDRYAPDLARRLRELSGPGAPEGGFAYNFSQGPTLPETPLWHAALLPLAFLAQGERREDLMALFLSPYYQALTPHQSQLSAWDRLFRETATAQVWEALEGVVREKAQPVPELAALLDQFRRLWGLAPAGAGSGQEWVTWLKKAWSTLGFPGDLSSEEGWQWEKAVGVLEEFAAAPTGEALSAAQVLTWLHLGAEDITLPGPGTDTAGIQGLGWLEMRGLDFDRVLCLGMTSAALPGAARSLPLLSRREREQVLGGTQESQDRFAQEVFENLLGAAPRIVITRPAQENQEPRLGTPFYTGIWEERSFSYLGRPHPAWVRAPAVQAALTCPEGDGPPGPLSGCLKIKFPPELKVTQLANALGCLLRFVFEEIWGLKELPDIASGLDPRERGQTLHEILARFVKEARYRLPPEGEALGLLQDVARQVLGERKKDPDWEAEWRRWFGDELTPGLLPAWLDRERERKLHEILARFVKEARYRLPPEGEALGLLQDVARQVLGERKADPHWEAEWRRWFGDELTPGLLPAWLDRERERQAQGWRWLAAEAAFQGLTRPGWPFTVRGRLDRVDVHPEEGLMVWDYKTGELPPASKVFDQKVEFQLPAYLWAVREGRLAPDWAAVAALAAGFIGLKSPRENHLQHQDFAGKKEGWAEVLTAWEEEVRRLGERLLSGDLAPEPRPAPGKSDKGACAYCPFPLLCAYEAAGEEVEEGA